MPGPIVRSGPSSQYQKNWNSAFGERTAKTTKSAAGTAKKKATKKKK